MNSETALADIRQEVEIVNLKANVALQDEATLRDQFAMAALTGCLAYSYVCPSKGNYHENCDAINTAKAAYGYADAMLEARKAEQ